MKEKTKRRNWREYTNAILPFLGPILFEIANSVTGDWITAENKVNLSTGKCVTILIGIVYIIVMIYLICYDIHHKKFIEKIELQLKNMKKKATMYEKSMDTVSDLLAYSGEKLKSQIDYLNEHNKIDVRDLNINAASTNIAKIIYQSIIERNGGDAKFTVNIYSRANENGAEYLTMIAHEGQISQPGVLGVKRLLCSDKKKSRYCEKIVLSEAPDYRILLDKSQVAKAFNQNQSKCKYNQYLGIPVRRMGGMNIALIEIVAHNDTVLWETSDDAILFAANYCEVLKEYILLMDRMCEQGKAVARKMQEGGVQYERRKVYIGMLETGND